MSEARYQVLKVRLDAIKAEMKNAGKEYFNEASKNIFERFPKMESFGWVQYTPYFNDGDTCKFGVSSDPDSVEVNGTNGYSSSNVAYPGYTASREALDAYYDARKMALKLDGYEAVSELLKSLTEEDLEMMFGDHTRVTVHRDGTIETEDYEHD